MVKIFERHRIWTSYVNPKIQGVIPEAEHESRKLALDVISESMQDSLISIIRHYTNPYECLLQKLIISWKEEMMTMENYPKEIKSIIDQLTTISITILEDLLSLLLFHSLPKEYQRFKKLLFSNDLLPSSLILNPNS
jgi:hypothetical protein